MEIVVEDSSHPTGDALPVEIVERKGLGHPDTICDLLAERLSNTLSRYYRDRYGLVLHHNVDKALLWAGATRPAYGGGEVMEPMELYLAGRATTEMNGDRIPVAEIAEETVREWFGAHFQSFGFDRHFTFHSLIRSGSPELVELFQAQKETGMALANDTSCGVGFAPHSTLERVVADVEACLNHPQTKAGLPAIGTDIKVMGLRHDDRIELTVACAMIDGFVHSIDEYLDCKNRVAALAEEKAKRFTSLPIRVEVNTADDPRHDRIYLTVTGTSAEAGDDGQAGRGNRANGLITPFRPMTMESVAGKNPVTHVGKLYNVTAEQIAQSLVSEVEPISSVECYLVSQIGQPVREPKLVDIRVATFDGPPTAVLREEIEAVVADHLAGIDRLWERLIEDDELTC